MYFKFHFSSQKANWDTKGIRFAQGYDHYSIELIELFIKKLQTRCHRPNLVDFRLPKEVEFGCFDKDSQLAFFGPALGLWV